MRNARTYPKFKYIPIWTSSNTPSSTMNTGYYAYLGKDGNLKLNQNNTPVSTISNIDPAMFARCNDGNAITNIIIKIGQNLYPVQPIIQGNNTLITLPVASGDDITHCNSITKKCNYTINYIRGTQQISKTITRSQGSTYIINTDNLINTCAFKLTFASGNLIISNNITPKLWSLNNSYNLTTPDSQVNLDWKKIYNEYFNKTPRIDLSLLPVDTPFGQGQPIPYLLTSDGKYKLTIKNGQLVLFGCVIACQNKINGISFTKNSDKNDNNVFYLYGIKKDIRNGKTMIADNSNNTLMPIPPGGIFNSTNKYTSIAADSTNNLYPPSIQTLNTQKYNHFNINSEQCKQKCIDTSGCTHNYSYNTTDNVNHCIINKDSTQFSKYVNFNSTIKSSTLNIRDQNIISSSPYLTPTYTNTNTNPAQIKSVDNTTMLNYSILPTTILTDKNLYNTSINDKLHKLKSPTLVNTEPFTTTSFLSGGSNRCADVISSNSNYIIDCSNTLATNISYLKDYSAYNRTLQSSVNTKYNKLGQDINAYKGITVGGDDMVSTDGTLTFKYDKNNPYKRVEDVRLNDLNDILLQQNLLYISGSLTVATLIVAAIIISRK